MWYCYIILMGRRSYIGMSNDPWKRLRRHNRELSGGAKATQKRATDDPHARWRHAAVVGGLLTKQSALQFEYALKRLSRGCSGVARVDVLRRMLEEKKACKKCGSGCQHKWDWTALTVVYS
jgi:predicted GIY-YIG superfamily endonuclease